MTVRSLESVHSLRYFRFCNVLHIWTIRAIPTYRVYRLYDNTVLLYIDGRIVPNEDPTGDDIEIKLEDVFSFATGSDHEPPLGFANKPRFVL